MYAYRPVPQMRNVSFRAGNEISFYFTRDGRDYLRDSFYFKGFHDFRNYIFPFFFPSVSLYNALTNDAEFPRRFISTKDNPYWQLKRSRSM